MALLTTIIIDQSLQTSILTVTKNGNSVETITYSNTLKQVTFNTRPDISLSVLEFVDYCNQVNIFQTSILFNFNPSTSLVYPFGSCNTTENHDTILNKWNLVSIFGASPRVCNYSADIPTLMVDLVNRASPKVIEFNEWLYWLNDLNHYRLSLRGL